MRSLAVALLLLALVGVGAQAEGEVCGQGHSDCKACRALECVYDGVSGFCGPPAEEGDVQRTSPCSDIDVAELAPEWNRTLQLTRPSAFLRYTVTEASASNRIVLTASSTHVVGARAVLLEPGNADWLTAGNVSLSTLENATLASHWTASTSFFASYGTARLEISDPRPGILLFEVFSSTANASAVSTVVVTLFDGVPTQDNPNVGGRGPSNTPLVYGIVAASFVLITLVLSLLIVKVRRVEQRFLMAYLEIMGLLPDPDWPATPPLVRLQVESGKGGRGAKTLIDGEPYSGPLATEFHEGVTVYYSLVALPDGVAIGGSAVPSASGCVQDDTPPSTP